MNIVPVTAVFLVSLVLCLGNYGPTTLKREFTFISELGSWMDISDTCEIMFNGSLITDDSITTSTVLRYFKEENVWTDDLWIGLFVAELQPPDYKWKDSCMSQNLSVYSGFYLAPYNVNPYEMCIFKKNLTTWEFGSCLTDRHSGICEQYSGPCTYVRDTAPMSCTKGIVWSASMEVNSLEECENYCSSIAPMTIGEGECWAVTYVPYLSEPFGVCYPSVSINPFQFESTQSIWYEDVCTQNQLEELPTKVSWKRCFKKPVSYFGPIIYTSRTLNSICSDTTTTTPTSETTLVGEVTTGNVTENTTGVPETTTLIHGTTSSLPETTTTVEEITPSPVTEPTTHNPETTTSYIKRTPPSLSDYKQTTFFAQSIAECLCTCIENENLTLSDKMLELKQETTVNKQETAAHTRTLQSANDNRPSAQGIGMVLGIGLITVVIFLVSLGDIIALSSFIIIKLNK